MRQLSGLDASFLYFEMPNAPMHIGSVAIYDPSTAPGGKVRFKEIVANIGARAHLIPSLTSRLVTVPMSADHPYWVADGQYDPEFHIRHMALPQPGDWRQLCILVSRLHARPLDRNRPLWEAYVIEGLDNVEGYPKGCFAVYMKVHHAAIDGASGVEMNTIVHDLSPVPERVDESQVFSVDTQPKNLELLIRAGMNKVKIPLKLATVIKNSGPGFAKAFSGVATGRLKRITDIPRTRFNRTVSSHRVFEAIRLDLSEIKAIKNAASPCTVNDVALAIVGGGLRRYLAAKNELPTSTLVAMAPVNVRSKEKLGTGGNEVSQMTVSLSTDVEGGRARLMAVNESTRNAKELTNAVGAKSMTDYSQFIPPTLAHSAAKLASRAKLANRFSPIYNCVVTNVPGPPIPIFYTGAKMLCSYGTGPVLDSVGLFHAVSSYCNEFTIAFTACREMMPDPEFYKECLMASLAELQELVGEQTDEVMAKP
jgi:diacylglycerol O-acyltransferase